MEQLEKIKELLLMPCTADDLKKGMVVYFHDGKSLNVDYVRCASYDFTWVKFKEVNEETLQKRYEKFNVLVSEEEIDKQRDVYGYVPLWCLDSVGNIRFDSIPIVK